MKLFSPKSNSKINLIVDIQSSVVRGSLVFKKNDSIPEVVWTNSIDIPFRVSHNNDYLVDITVKAIENIASSAHVFIKDKQSHPELPEFINKVHCVLSSPWIISQARTVHQEFEKDTRVTRSHLTKIINDEKAKMLKDGKDNLIGIEEKVFDIKLNGYSMPEWESGIARTFEVSFAVSLASQYIINRFRESCKKSGIHNHNIDFHSSLLLQHIGLDQTLSSDQPYILIHIHGELTDIVVTSGKTCILFGSHPIGLRTILRQISDKLKISETATDSSLTLYENNQLDQLHNAKDIEHIQNILTDWVKQCFEIISLAPNNYIPGYLIISARFHEILFKNSCNAFKPEIHSKLLPENELFKLISFYPNADKLRLTALYTIAIQSLESLN